MTERRQRRWRIGLTWATAVLVALIVASTQRDLIIRWTGRQSGAGCSMVRGAMFVAYSDLRLTPPPPARLGWSCSSQSVFAPSTPVLLGSLRVSPAALGTPGWSLCLPLWPLAALTGGVSAWLWHRRATRPDNLCLTCRYDLTGLSADACPECGTPRKV